MLKKLIIFFKNLTHPGKAENELTDEIHFHLEMQIEENLKKGMVADEARRRAILQLGGMQQVKELCREVRPGYFIEILVQDLRHAIRSLRRELGFVCITLLTLALTIGATTAIFSIAKALLLQPLPYREPDRLVTLWNKEKDGSASNTSFSTFTDWKGMGAFESMAAMSYWQPTLTGQGDPEPLEGDSVSANFFHVLGVAPMLGRSFSESEDRPNRNRVVVLSYGLWERRFQKDETVIGKQIFLNGIPRTVIGVMPRSFQSLVNFNLKETEIWRPLGYDVSLPYACRTCNHLRVIARLRKGLSLEQASTDFDVFMKNVIASHPKEYGVAGAMLLPLREQFVSKTRSILVILFAAVLVVLLIACVNTAGLLLARGMKKEQEMVVRAALGASRIRLMGQLFTESALLAVAGGGLGLLTARWLMLILIASAPQQIPRMHSVEMDYAVLLFAGAITILAGFIFGILPAWRGSRVCLSDTLQESHRTTSGAATQRLRKLLVSCNIALAVMLLAAAGLILQSIQNQLRQEVGFSAENALTMSVAAVGLEYDDPQKLIQFWNNISQKLLAMPGVESAGLVSQLPLSKDVDLYTVRAKDKPLANPEAAPSAERFAVTSGYFSALKIRLFRGRLLTDQDRAGTQPVILINRTFAETIWPGENPIGKQVQIGGNEDPWRTVVGVVENVRHRNLQEPFHLQFYHPAEQWLIDYSMTVVVRSKGDPSVLLPNIRSMLRSLDQKAPLSDIATMKQVIQSTLAEIDFLLKLLRAFSFTALFLASVGIYGVMAYTARRRSPEIAIRMALGADRLSVVRMLTGDGVRLGIAGTLLGLAGCVLLTRFLKSLLFGIAPLDPGILAGTSFLLLGVCVLASMVPSLQAARRNPVETLRNS